MLLTFAMFLLYKEVPSKPASLTSSVCPFFQLYHKDITFWRRGNLESSLWVVNTRKQPVSLTTWRLGYCRSSRELALTTTIATMLTKTLTTTLRWPRRWWGHPWLSTARFKPGRSMLKFWNIFLWHFFFFFFFCGITDAGRKQAILLSSVGSRTYSLMRNLLSPDKPGDKLYEDLAKLLQSHYNLKSSEIVQRFKFNSRTRAAMESVTEYKAVLRDLAQHCNYGDKLLCATGSFVAYQMIASSGDCWRSRSWHLRRRWKSCKPSRL